MEALGNAVRFVYLAQLDGNEAVCDVLKRLIELDVEAPEEKLVFEDTNAGWKEAA
jgi:hypothetical protein